MRRASLATARRVRHAAMAHHAARRLCTATRLADPSTMVGRLQQLQALQRCRRAEPPAIPTLLSTRRLARGGARG